MAFADIATNTDINVKVFVKVSPIDVTDGTVTDLYFAHGEMSTDKIDGTLLEFEGRLRGSLKIGKLDQKIGGGTFAHPVVTFGLWIGDEDDALWDEFGDDDAWEGADCKVWTVDLDQDWTDSTDNGRRLQLDGKITRGPGRLGINRVLSIEARGAFPFDTLPNQIIANASESGCGYIQPVILNGNTAGALHTTISGVDTTVIPADAASGSRNITNYAPGNVVFCCDTGASTNPEQMYITAVTTTPGSESITVIRGYNGTTTAAHTAGDPLYTMQMGPNTRINTVDRNRLLVPYVFGGGNVDRNPYFMTAAYQIGRATRVYSANDWVELMLSMGKGPTIPNNKAWLAVGGGDIILANDDVYNDEANVLGTSLAWGSQVPVGATTNYHLQPHIELTGTYQDTQRSAIAVDASDLTWALIRGITTDETTGGDVIRWPPGIILYILQNSSYGLGLTLADVVYGDQITNYNAGDWADEFDHTGDESWWGQVAATVPAWGTTDRVKVMDFFQEVADFGLSDIWVRGGKLNPKRRAVARDVDFTINKWDTLRAPERIKSPQSIYCNRLFAGFAQPLICEPLVGSPGTPPVTVPYSAAVQDDDEVIARGLVEDSVNRAWVYSNFAATWISNFATDDDPQTAHLEWWEDATQAALDLRANVHPWMEVTLPERFAAIEQGETIEFDVAPHTTRKGQVRQVDLTTDDTGRVAQVKVRSWHIDF